jgi:hypothetical protein
MKDIVIFPGYPKAELPIGRLSLAKDDLLLLHTPAMSAH